MHHAGSVFRLYARANLGLGQVAGGRAVQTTSSANLGSGWEELKPVRIRGLDERIVGEDGSAGPEYVHPSHSPLSINTR
eukprot:3390334-Prymnesium_polylepis.2